MIKYGILVLLGFCNWALGQQVSYEINLTPITINELGGLQSYAIGQHDGEWLIIGGRLDGLHRRQPFAAFDVQGHNQDMIVVNPSLKKVWKTSLANLPISIKEQFSSTNMQFVQAGSLLLLTGGYGYSASKGDHITYPYLTVIDLPNTIAAVKEDRLGGVVWNQLEDDMFRVTGGRLLALEGTYYQVGGHKFMGRYNPMGPTHGPGFEQVYTHEARRFKLTNTSPVVIEKLAGFYDEFNLRRRDYNLLPIISKGKPAMMAYSGVFQKNADLPWLYPVLIDDNGVMPLTDFSQKFNHYHCASLPIYNESFEEMHSLFFGGIAQFYMDGDTLVQDNDVPFVKSIADMIILADGSMKEVLNETAMPDYFGAGSEFIIGANMPLYADGILNGDLLEEGWNDIGYIYGGIKSSASNIFWVNDGAQSEASATIFNVQIRKSLTTTDVIDYKQEPSLLIYPNPAQKYVRLTLHLYKVQDINVTVYDMLGKKIAEEVIDKSNLVLGSNHLQLKDIDVAYGTYLYQIRMGTDTILRKVVWTE